MFVDFLSALFIVPEMKTYLIERATYIQIYYYKRWLYRITEIQNCQISPWIVSSMSDGQEVVAQFDVQPFM